MTAKVTESLMEHDRKEGESAPITAEEQAREARIEGTRQRAKELLSDPEFIAAIRSSCTTVNPMSEEDADLLRRLNEGEFRRELNIRLYGRDWDKRSEDRDGE